MNENTNIQEQPSNKSPIQGLSQIPGLKMKSLTIKLSEGPDDDPRFSGHHYRLVMKYLLEFDVNVEDKALLDLRQAIAGNKDHKGWCVYPKLRHIFFDEDNAVIPFLLNIQEINFQYIAGGADAITGVQGEAFRVLLAVERCLDPGKSWHGAQVFIGDNDLGEHPLNKAKKVVAHIRG